ncbi:hypothetical protein AXF42_Ash018125 [Apostasia shenzhenica]|uniref:Uncharacterized protein n=1 Tax=Apostasia shenzhenica TaxID=1088818 RepID=A0A2I0AF21_9ASPA|nr:hypothetical protein AXF42_Ash018125 [Apostasia shenzhenica]
MATEVCSATQRNCFSGGPAVLGGGNGRRRDASLPLDPAASDFNFSIDSTVSSDDTSTADELFSGGKILPFFKVPSKSANASSRSPALLPKPILDSFGTNRDLTDSDAGSTGERRSGGLRSFWRFGRSCSVGNESNPGKILPFSLHRSKSAGSSPGPIPNPARRRPQTAGASLTDSNQRKTYYYSPSQRGSQRGGVPISPVLNVPAPLISRSGGNTGGSSGAAAATGLFAYLLCNCGGDEGQEEISAELAALQLNGAGRVGLAA